MGLAFRITGFNRCFFLYERKEDLWLFGVVYVLKKRQKIPWQNGQLEWQDLKCVGRKGGTG
jgi:hypothetical protein